MYLHRSKTMRILTLAVLLTLTVQVKLPTDFTCHDDLSDTACDVHPELGL